MRNPRIIIFYDRKSYIIEDYISYFISNGFEVKTVSYDKKFRWLNKITIILKLECLWRMACVASSGLHNFDFALFVKELYLSPSFMRLIKYWYGHLTLVGLSLDFLGNPLNSSDNIKASLRWYDAYMSPQDHYSQFLLSCGLKTVIPIDYYIPQILFDNVMHPSSRRTFRVSVIANFEAARADCVNYLLENGVDVKVFGNGWSRTPKTLTALNRIKHSIRPCPISYCWDIYARSVINIAFLRESECDVVTSRSFEILAAGGLMLHQHSAHMESRLSSSDHCFVRYFDTKEDLLRKTEDMLVEFRDAGKLAIGRSCGFNWARRFGPRLAYSNIKESLFCLK